MKNEPKTRYVQTLPDLITPEEYDRTDVRKVKIQIRITPGGVEILGDSMYPHILEKLLVDAGAREMEGVLCG